MQKRLVFNPPKAPSSRISTSRPLRVNQWATCSQIKSLRSLSHRLYKPLLRVTTTLSIKLTRIIKLLRRIPKSIFPWRLTLPMRRDILLILLRIPYMMRKRWLLWLKPQKWLLYRNRMSFLRTPLKLDAYRRLISMS